MDVREKIEAGEYDSQLPVGPTRREDERRLRDKFKADLEFENQTAGLPKADRLFEMAWAEAHSAGFHEVAATYENMAELIRP